MTNKKNLRDFYDKEAMAVERYSNKHFWERRYHNKRMTILKGFLKNSLAHSKNFLDIGCGTGEYLSFAQQYVYDVTGLDLSKNYLQRCKFSKANNLILGDIKNLPFKDRTFDCVLCSEVIEHVETQNIATHEFLRVSNGFVLVSTPNNGILRVIMSRLRPRLLALIDASVGHVCVLSFPELIDKFRNQPWNIITAFTVHIFPPFLDAIHFPRILAPFVSAFEYFLNKLLPTMGSVSIVYLKRIPARGFI